MENLLRELRHAARALSKRPGFTAMVVLTLALGIGAATAIFSLVNGVLLQPLPYPESGRIMQLHETGEDGGTMRWGGPNFIDVRERSESFVALAAYTTYSMTAVGDGDAVRADGALVSDDFFAVIGARLAVGRELLAEETRDADAVVVISDDFWQREFNASSDAIGKILTIDREPHVIVGVMPPGMAFPASANFWIPYALSPDAIRTAHNWSVIGRLADGVSVATARHELGTIARQLHETHGDDTDIRGVSIVSLQAAIAGTARSTLLILLGAAGCLLLIACANVTNLLLARATSGQRELAVRLALGAGRSRLAGRFLAESLLLALAGGALGVLLAAWLARALLELAPEHLPGAAAIGVDAIVLAFALGVSMLTALGTGFATAWRATGSGLRHSLADGQRSRTGGTGSRRVRGVLVAAQIALTLVLLTGAGLLGRSFMRLLEVDPGFRTSNAVVMEVLLPRPEDDAAAVRLAGFHRALLERLRAIPGVTHAGGINAFPLSDRGASGGFLLINRPDEVTSFADWQRLGRIRSRTGDAEYRVASRDYFHAMDIPLVRGRLFEVGDTPDTPHAALVSESLAMRQWPGENPIGKLIQFGNMDGDIEHPFTVVGVVGDVRDAGLAVAPRPTLYACSCQRVASLGGRFTIAIRGDVAGATLAASARRALKALDPGVPVRFSTLEQVISRSLADRQFSMSLLGAFGVTALLLAAMGIYGVIAYLVAQQTREFGIRMALGAQAGAVLQLVLRRGAVLALAGLGAGFVIALAATRVLASQLFTVSATDPAVFAAVASLLAAVALLAAYIPAHRATKVDPMTALREE